MTSEIWLRRGGITWLAFPALAAAGALAACSARQGGESGFPYASLNLAAHTGDDPGRVRQNRLAWAAALGIEGTRMVAPAQVHGNRVRRAGAGEAGRGVVDADPLPDCDALITDSPALFLTAFFADCVPVFLVDPAHRAVGLAHAGWRGTAGRVAVATLRAMQEAFGTRPEDCLAAVGPAIGACCYQVGEEVVEALRASATSMDGQLVRAGGTWRVDLKNINARQLLEAGVAPERLTVSRFCTSCRPDLFYSYRRDGRSGRMAAVLGWPEMTAEGERERGEAGKPGAGRE